MRKLDKLRLKALESCRFRGHQMKPFCRKYRYWWTATCRVCGKTVTVNEAPDPNDIKIGGEALALYCTN